MNQKKRFTILYTFLFDFYYLIFILFLFEKVFANSKTKTTVLKINNWALKENKKTTPRGVRIPVSSVKGRCPGPLDDGGYIDILFVFL